MEQNNQVPGKGLAVAALVLGIVSVALGWILPLPIVGQIITLILGIVALVLAILAQKKSKEAGIKNGMATAGLVLSIIGIISSILALAICGCTAAAIKSAADSGQLDEIVNQLADQLETVIETVS